MPILSETKASFRRRKLGILVTGHLPVELAAEYGDYGRMFASFLAGRGYRFDTYPVIDGQFPQTVRSADGWIVTGSRHGVYEERDWIRRLEAFVLAARDARRPMVGICFGHQIMALALGGSVEKYPGGWSVGSTDYSLADGSGSLNVLAWHQDQVTKPPAGAEVIASNDFCAYAALRYGDWGLSFQAHPEFTSAYFASLALARRDVVGQALIDDALTRTTNGSSADVARRIVAHFEECWAGGTQSRGLLRPDHRG